MLRRGQLKNRQSRQSQKRQSQQNQKDQCTPKAGIYFQYGQTCFSNAQLKQMAKALHLRILSKPKLVKRTQIAELMGPNTPEQRWPNQIAVDMKIPLEPKPPGFQYTEADIRLEQEFDIAATADEYQKKLKVYRDAVQLREAVRQTENTAFRPSIGARRGEWLGTEQIDAYLTMLTKYSTYRNIVAQFSHNLPSLKTPEEDLRKKYLLGGNWKHYIIITNTKRAGRGSGDAGEHWVVIYVNRTKSMPGLEYWDGARPGIPPAKDRELRKLWRYFCAWNGTTETGERLSQGAKSLFTTNGEPLPVHVNETKVQFENTECAMFAMYYVAERVKGRSMRQITRRSEIDDAKCSSLRKRMFRN